MATQLLSHLLSVGGAALFGQLPLFGAGTFDAAAHAVLPMGSLLLLWLQFTRLRHPPALASGGAVLCGLDPIAVIGCVAVTGAVLLAELSVSGRS